MHDPDPLVSLTHRVFRAKRSSRCAGCNRRIARGFRNRTNYRLRMILAAGRLTHPNLR